MAAQPRKEKKSGRVLKGKKKNKKATIAEYRRTGPKQISLFELRSG
jgi:hypothetical protein